MAKKRKGVYARDVDLLNFIFALVALGCLASVGWMIWDDYAREWKSYQRRFQVIENEVTQQQLKTVQAQVDQQKLTQLTEQRDSAERELEAQQDSIAVLEDKLEEVQTKLSLATQEFRFARSIYDARRWSYEEAAHQPDGDASSERARMEEADQRLHEAETLLEDLTEDQAKIQSDLDSLHENLSTAEAGLSAMTREIERLEDRLNNLRFGIVYAVRNAPVLDAFNPSLRINQVVLNDLPVDLNFTTSPRVDRCQSCHLGIASAAYEEQQQPFKSHPRLDLFVADASPHPVGEFGCTICHFGKGQATSFYSAVHSPGSDREAHRWAEEYGWSAGQLWEWPMRPSYETESSCLKCHVDETWVSDAPQLQYGLDLIENLGCFGCHALDRFANTRKPGPSLEHVGVKTNPKWAFNWVMNPKSFRPNTRMPKFFNLANTSDEYWQDRNVVEVDAIVAYVFAKSTAAELDSPPPGNAARGEALVKQIGCLGCHIVEEPGSNEFPQDQTRFTGYRYQGPNLYGVGSKANASWLYTWIRNPKHYWADMVMPNLRLTTQEAADVTSYLSSLRKPGWDDPEVPTVNAELRDQVALEYLRKQAPGAEAQKRLSAMNVEEERLYLGEQLIGRYGCFSCHVIPGFEDRGRIGTELSTWGSKPVTRLDFGLLDLPLERRPWLEQKLRSPRSFDEGKVKQPQELFRMPNFQLTETEIDAIATAILGFTDEEIPPSRLPAKTPRRAALEAGRALISKYSCRSCHIIEDEGGAIREVIAAQGVAEGQTRPAALAFAPPNLRTEGAKVQPDWLYKFLRQPQPIRPWLKVRMPTFQFSDQELNTLTRYFAALDGARYPFDEKFTTAHTYPRDLVRSGEQLASVLQCFRCHVRGGVNPPGSPENWAPDMTMAPRRLRYEWLLDWIADPQKIMPGAKMPQFFTDLSPGSSYVDMLDKDPRRQIEALASYIMSLGR